MIEWISLAPIFCVILGGLLLMIVDAFWSENSDPAFIAVGSLSLACLSAAALWFYDIQVPLPEYATGYLATGHDALFFDLVLCSGAALSAALAGGYLRTHKLERGEYYALMLFSTVGAMVLARALDLLVAFIGLETMSLGIYSLVAFRRGSPRSAEASVKYFLLGAFAAAVLLFGCALIYGATGYTDLHNIGAAIAAGQANTNLLLLSMALLVVGVAFKVSAVPFHMWTPDAYEGAVTPSTTFMAVVVKAAAFAFFIRLLLTAFGDPMLSSPTSGWPPLIAGLAAITLLFGNVAGLMQSSVKRMLAYSSIAHAGFVLMGMVAAAKLGRPPSEALFYLVAYTFSNVLTFGSLILMGSYRKEAVSYEDLAGVGRRHPLAAFPFVVGLLSLMGMPPTAGFFAKYYVLVAAVEAGDGMVYLALLGAVASAIGAYYYLRVIVFMFMKEPEAGAPIAVPLRSGYVTFALIVSSYFVLRIGFGPMKYIDWSASAAAALG